MSDRFMLLSRARGVLLTLGSVYCRTAIQRIANPGATQGSPSGVVEAVASAFEAAVGLDEPPNDVL